jgi:hypothetical protein
MMGRASPCLCLFILTLLATGCRSRALPLLAEGPIDLAEDLLLPAESHGVVEGAQFEEHIFGLSLQAPAGWRLAPGPQAGALVVSVRDSQTGALLEAWHFSGEASEPRPRAECLWSTADTGRYGGLRLAEAFTAATCVPEDPLGPRVLAYIVVHPGGTWQLELHLPQAALIEGKERAEALLETVRFGS